MSTTLVHTGGADPATDERTFGRTEDEARFEEIARVIRTDIVRMLAAAPSGHTAGPWGWPS